MFVAIGSISGSGFGSLTTFCRGAACSVCASLLSRFHAEILVYGWPARQVHDSLGSGAGVEMDRWVGQIRSVSISAGDRSVVLLDGLSFLRLMLLWWAFFISAFVEGRSWGLGNFINSKEMGMA